MVPDSDSRRRLSRYAAPVLFLLGVTVAVLLIRSGLGGGAAPGSTAIGPVTHPSTAASVSTATAPAGPGTTATTTGAQYYTVKHGDTFGSIAASEGTSVTAIEQLNPGVSSNALQVGQKVRIK